jgi:tRNA 2-thiouridine synthesizing protein A
MSVEKIDVKGKMCPMPVAFTKRKLESMMSGQLLEVTGEGESESENIQRWVKNNGHEVVQVLRVDGEFKLLIRKKS